MAVILAGTHVYDCDQLLYRGSLALLLVKLLMWENVLGGKVCNFVHFCCRFLCYKGQVVSSMCCASVYKFAVFSVKALVFYFFLCGMCECMCCVLLCPCCVMCAHGVL